MHSKVQIRALAESGGKSQSQRSQFGLNSSMMYFLYVVSQYHAEYQFEYLTPAMIATSGGHIRTSIYSNFRSAMPVIFTYQQLKAIATRKEQVRSRQLVKLQKLPIEQALLICLEQSMQHAGLQDISQLAEQRSEIKSADQAQKLARRSEKLQQRLTQHSSQQSVHETADTWLAWFDGSALPNPGKCQIACVLTSPDGHSFEYVRNFEYGDSCDAEYSGLLLALEQAHQHQARHLIVHGDSQVVIDDFNQSKASKLARMLEYRQQAQTLAAAFEQLQVCWVPRHKNQLADALTQMGSHSTA
ncbi:ribonuclease HI family protein [Undibacterium sp. JH2W]|uniref:ribonuclease HI family protein n=1 Tax=Undibacterium sp. JH2W TaxID=3413037 RepID=UPI003BF3FCC3